MPKIHRLRRWTNSRIINTTVNSIKPQRIGFFGGRFDPIHIGHLILAQTALESLELDQVLFMPSGGFSHYKDQGNVASGQDRYEMIRLAINTNPQFQISSYEIEQNKFCYTIDTLRYLRETIYKNQQLILLIGGDWLDKIPTWKEGERLLKEFSIGIFSRPGFREPCSVESNVQYIKMPLIDISSSLIRERRELGMSVRYFLPESVHHYVIQHNLYR